MSYLQEAAQLLWKGLNEYAPATAEAFGMFATNELSASDLSVHEFAAVNSLSELLRAIDQEDDTVEITG